MIMVAFVKCYVCGEDVATEFPIARNALAACASHSKEDRRLALNQIQAEIDSERSKL